MEGSDCYNTKVFIAHHTYFTGNMGHNRKIVALVEAISALGESFVCVLGDRPSHA